MFTRVAVGFDESPESQRAYRAALDLARLTSAHIFLLMVIEELPAYVSYASAVAPDVPRRLKDERRRFYKELHAKAAKDGAADNVVVKSEIVEGIEVDTILALLAELRPDLLVVGLRQQDSVLSRVLGGTAHQLALHANCNVLGIR